MRKYCWYFLEETQLCAGGGAQDTCQGDSGGPLLSNVVGVSIFQSWAVGRRQHCRDNVTKFSGHKVVGLCIITIFDVTILHLNNNGLTKKFLVGSSMLR